MTYFCLKHRCLMKVTYSQKLKIKVLIYWSLPRNNELVPPYIVAQREKRRRAWCAVFFSLFRVTGSVWPVGTIDRKRERATSAISNERDTGEKRRGREASLFSLLDPDHRLRRKRKRCFNIRPSPNTNLSSRYIKIQP